MNTAGRAFALSSCLLLLGAIPAGGAEPAGAPPAQKEKFAWTVKATQNMALSVGDPIPIHFAIGPVPATNVSVREIGLVEKSTRRPFEVQDRKLCMCMKQPCSDSVTEMDEHSARTYWLWAGDRPGHYEGYVAVGSREKPEGETIPMTVYVSSDGYRLSGLGLLCLGILVAWILTVYLRLRSNRLLLLLSAEVLKGRVELLRSLVASTSQDIPGLRTMLALIEGDLAIPRLEENGLPSEWPTWPPAAPRDAEYKKYIDRISGWIDSLEFVIQRGVVALLSLKAQAEAKGQMDAWRNAAAAIEGQVARVKDDPAESVRNKVDATIQELRAALVGRKPESTSQPGEPTPLSSIRRVKAGIALLSMAGFVLVAIITAVAGYYILILGNPGYGTPNDLLLSFLWGLGLPAGTQLMQSTPLTIAASLQGGAKT